MSTAVTFSNPRSRCRTFVPQSDPGSINRLPVTFVGYLLSFVSIRDTYRFKRTRHEYFDITRTDVSLFILSSSLHRPLDMDQYIRWTRDRVKEIIARTPQNDGMCYVHDQSTIRRLSNQCIKFQIERLEITDAEITDLHMTELNKISTLKDLRLSYKNYEAVISDEGLKEISSLELSKFTLADARRITPIGLRYLGGMRLKSLTLGQCRSFKREELEPLLKLPLEALDMGIGISRYDTAWLINGIPTLKRLNGRKIREEMFTPHIFRMFREVILGFLAHPKDDKNLRETSSFFRSLYPRQVNLIFADAFNGWGTLGLIRNPVRVPTDILAKIKQLYEVLGGRIHGIQASIAPNLDDYRFKESVFFIKSLKKLELNVLGCHFSVNKLFQNLQGTSLNELHIQDMGSIQEVNWNLLKPLSLTHLSVVTAQRGGPLRYQFFDAIENMPIRQLTLSYNDNSAWGPYSIGEPELHNFLPRFLKLPLEELSILPGIRGLDASYVIHKDKRHVHDKEFQFLAQEISSLKRINGRVITRQTNRKREINPSFQDGTVAL